MADIYGGYIWWIYMADMYGGYIAADCLRVSTSSDVRIAVNSDRSLVSLMTTVDIPGKGHGREGYR